MKKGDAHHPDRRFHVLSEWCRHAFDSRIQPAAAYADGFGESGRAAGEQDQGIHVIGGVGGVGA